MLYANRIKKILDAPKKDNPLILGIETSCDDTSAAVLRGEHEVLSVCADSQIMIHREFGGVVPELASRNHVKNLTTVVSAAIEQANISLDMLDAVAVTSHPGLLGALLTGVNYAKGLCYSLGIPLISVNHIAGHISANFITHEDLKPPFVCLVASGGHSRILHVTDYGKLSVLGETLDDAAGEALDKIARVIGLPYPGGPYLEELAQGGNPTAFNFRSPFNMSKSNNFSFSGIKTAVVSIIHKAEKAKAEISTADIAASFQQSVIETLVHKTILAAQTVGESKIAIAGGVSANSLLREQMNEAALRNNMRFFCPEMKYCTDNGAMIACAGYHQYLVDDFTSLDLDAAAN